LIELGISKDEIKQRLRMKPFRQAIENLRKIRQYETPIDKMRCITLTSRYVVQAIDRFWKNVSAMDKKKLTLDAD